MKIKATVQVNISRFVFETDRLWFEWFYYVRDKPDYELCVLYFFDSGTIQTALKRLENSKIIKVHHWEYAADS